MSLWMCSGGVTDSQVVVAVNTQSASTACRIAWSLGDTLSATPNFTAPLTTDAQGYVKATLTGLTADTTYSYGIEIFGSVNGLKGKVKTFPTQQHRSSFSFVHGSCGINSARPIYTAIKNRAPRMFLHLGDLHYQDIATNDPSLFRAGFDIPLFGSTQGALTRAVPWAYVWDNHDLGGGHSDKTFVGNPAAQSAYRQCIPSYPLADSAAIYQSWWLANCFFIMLDVRSYRDNDDDTDSPTKTIMGATQKAWLKQQMLDAQAAGATYIFWLSSSIWRVSTPFTGTDQDDDQWGAFAYERTELADFCKANGIHNLIVLQGDAHMLAHDGAGIRSDFATGGGAPTPNFCAAALDQSGLTRGADWPSGTSPGTGRYGLMTVTDDGVRAPSIAWQGMFVDPTTGVESVVMTYDSSGTFTRYPTRVYSGSQWVASPIKARDSAAFSPETAQVWKPT